MFFVIAGCGVPVDSSPVDGLPEYCEDRSSAELECRFAPAVEGCFRETAGGTGACQSYEPLFPECATWVGRGGTDSEPGCPTWDEVVERSGILDGTGRTWLDLHGHLEMWASRDVATREWSPWIRWSVASSKEDSENRIVFHFHPDGRLRGIEQVGWSVYVGNVETFCCEATNGYVNEVATRWWGDVPRLEQRSRWIGPSLANL